MTQDVVLLGAGGLAREVVQATLATGAGVRVIGMLDDDPGLRGLRVAGREVLGTTAEVRTLAPDVRVVATVASPADPHRRSRLTSRLGLPDERYGRIVHPSACLATDTALGAGTVVLAGVVATSGVRLGRHAVIMPTCVLAHDVDVGDAVTLASGVLLAGGVVVESGAYLGAGAKVREGVRIGAGAVVGMGAVVLKDIPGKQIWAGVPARRLPAR